MSKLKIKRITLISATVLILVIIIVFTRIASEQNGTRSNQVSGKVVNYTIEKLIKNDIPINRDDIFWRMTANILVRKAAHFAEYMLIGLFLSISYSFFIRKMWILIPGALVTCFLIAYFDEFRQQFVEGRESTWMDVKIDSYGSLTGILLAVCLIVVYRKFRKLKNEVQALKAELDNRDSDSEKLF